MGFTRDGIEADVAASASDLLIGSWSDTARIDWLDSDNGLPTVWGVAAETGWSDLFVGEADGGLDLGPVVAAAVAEQVGRHLFPGPVVDTIASSGGAQGTSSVRRPDLLLPGRSASPRSHGRRRGEYAKRLLPRSGGARRSGRRPRSVAAGGRGEGTRLSHGTGRCEDAVQVHGGVGFTAEHILSDYFLRVLSLENEVAPHRFAAAGSGSAALADGRAAPREG